MEKPTVSTDNTRPTITPALTVGDLLRHYPDLDEPLACLVPTYRALSTPAMRQAVAAPMSLQQLAAGADVPLDTLLTGLRHAAGVAETPGGADDPPWVATAVPATTLDARPILAGGGHPLSRVMQGLSELGPDEIYLLLTPFVPAPLIDMARSMGYEAYSRWEGDVLHTFFRRQPEGGQDR